MEPVEANQLTRKSVKLMSKGFNEVGPVKSSISFLLVPNVHSDIGVVCDATTRSLNDYIFPLSLCIPTTAPIIINLDHSLLSYNEDIAK